MSVCVLGLDPGFASFGYARLELLHEGERVVDCGVLQTTKDPRKQLVLATDDNLRRANELARGLDELLAGERVALVAVEAMSFPRSSSVAAKMALAWGVLVGLASKRALAIVQATPQRVKKSVVGLASASKDDVRAALERRYGALPLVGPAGRHEHQVDAIASAVCALDSETAKLARRLAA